jgi:hypothetical protein
LECDFVEVRISVSPEDVIRQNIVILHGTPERSIIGQICKLCFTGSDVISVSNSDVYGVNMEGSVVTAKTINLDTLQSPKTIFNSTYILVNKNTDLIANVTILSCLGTYVCPYNAKFINIRLARSPQFGKIIGLIHS